MSLMVEKVLLNNLGFHVHPNKLIFTTKQRKPKILKSPHPTSIMIRF